LPNSAESSPAAERQVHLEEALLAVDEAQAARDVEPGLALQHDGALRIARDRQRRGQAGQTQRAIELRQALAHRPPGGRAEQHRQQQQGGQHAPRET